MHLPIFTSPDQAVALAQQRQDIFYVAAFGIQTWLGDLLTEAITEYSEKPDPADRCMQTGQAWRAFQPTFGRICDEEFHLVISFLTRFAQCENPVSTRLHAALIPVYREHELSGEYFGPQGPDLSSLLPHQAVPLMHRFVERTCDWLDAMVHISAHILWVHEPACFNPDPDKRRIAGEETILRHGAQQDAPEMVVQYLQTPGTPRQKQASPSSSHSSANGGKKPWPFAKLDESIITLWPLVKRHNWTYADLWNVLSRSGIPLVTAPCQNHRQLAHYCLHTLGLRKSGHGQTTRNSLPPGHALANRFLGHFRRRHRTLGYGPWS